MSLSERSVFEKIKKCKNEELTLTKEFTKDELYRIILNCKQQKYKNIDEEDIWEGLSTETATDMIKKYFGHLNVEKSIHIAWNEFLFKELNIDTNIDASIIVLKKMLGFENSFARFQIIFDDTMFYMVKKRKNIARLGRLLSWLWINVKKYCSKNCNLEINKDMIETILNDSFFKGYKTLNEFISEISPRYFKKDKRVEDIYKPKTGPSKKVSRQVSRRISKNPKKTTLERTQIKKSYRRPLKKRTLIPKENNLESRQESSNGESSNGESLD